MARQSPEVRLEFAPGEGARVATTLDEADPTVIVGGQPVRSLPSYAGMRHYPGWWWSATTGDLVAYESLLERDRVMIADFDKAVDAIAAQPFGLTGSLDGVKRTHVPDFLLCTRDGPLVVDVKPARLLKRAEVTELLEWTAGLMAERGWRYEVWSGESPRVLENLRFLAQGRRAIADDDALSALRSHALVGDALWTVLERASDCGASRASLTAAMVRLLWLQDWRVDLNLPLDGSSQLLDVEAAA